MPQAALRTRRAIGQHGGDDRHGDDGGSHVGAGRRRQANLALLEDDGAIAEEQLEQRVEQRFAPGRGAADAAMCPWGDCITRRRPHAR